MWKCLTVIFNCVSKVWPVVYMLESCKFERKLVNSKPFPLQIYTIFFFMCGLIIQVFLLLNFKYLAKILKQGKIVCIRICTPRNWSSPTFMSLRAWTRSQPFWTYRKATFWRICQLFPTNFCICEVKQTLASEVREKLDRKARVENACELVYARKVMHKRSRAVDDFQFLVLVVFLGELIILYKKWLQMTFLVVLHTAFL